MMMMKQPRRQNITYKNDLRHSDPSASQAQNINFPYIFPYISCNVNSENLVVHKNCPQIDKFLNSPRYKEKLDLYHAFLPHLC